jgi:BlaI family penicillinase repressor
MSRPPSSHPTELELEILKIVWRDGPSTVRQVRDALEALGRKLAHTSVITMMNIMVDKDYLKRARKGSGFMYTAKVARGATLGRMLRDIVDRAFGGSGAAAMLNLLETSDVSQGELDQLRQLITQKSKEQRS